MEPLSPTKPIPSRRSMPDRRDVLANLQSARSAARTWSKTVPERQRQQAAWAFTKAALDEYVSISSVSGATSLTPPAIALAYVLDSPTLELARKLGRHSAELPIAQACYHLSTAYTALVPDSVRSALGMYYTPPPLVDRLLDLAEEAGIDWCSGRTLDPACGGGAFLLPVALRMRKALAGTSPRKTIGGNSLSSAQRREASSASRKRVAFVSGRTRYSALATSSAQTAARARFAPT